MRLDVAFFWDGDVYCQVEMGEDVGQQIFGDFHLNSVVTCAFLGTGVIKRPVQPFSLLTIRFVNGDSYSVHRIRKFKENAYTFLMRKIRNN